MTVRGIASQTLDDIDMNFVIAFNVTTCACIITSGHRTIAAAV